MNWVVGLLVLTYITSGPPTVYGMVLFSAHMMGHMALTMVAPLFLVLGAPVTLALRALPARTDGSRGLREWVLIFVHSKFSQLVTQLQTSPAPLCCSTSRTRSASRCGSTWATS